MTAAHGFRRACIVARKYPTSMFWLLTCAIFAAGVQDAIPVLAVLLLLQLMLLAHTVRQLWAPPIRVQAGDRRDGDGRHARSGH